MTAEKIEIPCDVVRVLTWLLRIHSWLVWFKSKSPPLTWLDCSELAVEEFWRNQRKKTHTFSIEQMNKRLVVH